MDFIILKIGDREIGKIGLADTFALRLRGLLGRKLDGFKGIVIKPCNNIHMLFMGYPIDVLFVDQEGKIVKIDEELKPWILYSYARHAKAVVELETGTVKEFGIKLGETVAYGKDKEVSNEKQNTEDQPVV